MRIVVVGTGYVGLVTGAGFAEMGNDVACIDIDQSKIEALGRGEIPIYEPGLETLVKQNVSAGLLRFSTDLAENIREAEFVFIAVGTPPAPDGGADLSHILAVARDIGRHITQPLVVVDKSTVPVGTAEKVGFCIQQEIDARGVEIDFEVVSNPEFLKEGSALNDFLRPDRVIIGAQTDKAKQAMKALYAPFVRNHDRVLFMSVRDAEMTKYAANAMLATKISFINEIALLCDELDVDVENVRLGIGSDSRIGYSFIYPGCGYGGSCFPKDVSSIIHMARQQGVDSSILQAVESRNAAQKQLMFKRVCQYFGKDLHGLTFAVWGLAFKPGTDDIREAPSLLLIAALLSAGANVVAFDPVAMDAVATELSSLKNAPGTLTFAEDQYSVLQDADALVLMTEWKLFRQPDFSKMKELMKRPIIFDGRNQYEPAQLDDLGIEYIAVGRSNVRANGEQK